MNIGYECSLTCEQRPTLGPEKWLVLICGDSLLGGHICSKSSKWDLRMQGYKSYKFHK
jgi:hypothetical protein